MNIYSEQWDYLRTAWQQGRNPHSLLFAGAADQALNHFITQYLQLIFCKEHLPCGQCIECRMVANKEHPDIQWIIPDKKDGPIKVDQIRELQNYAYLTPQKSAYRLIIIDSADRMNAAAANALLKILEEPAPHTVFLLIAEQLSTVLPTILSRCQLVRFSSRTDFSNLLAQGEHYAQESAHAQMMQQVEVILDELVALLQKDIHPCVVAARWVQYDLQALLWLLYLIYTQIQIIHMKQATFSGTYITQIRQLVFLLDPLIVFSQIDKINTIKRKLSHNININHTLVLEDLLFDL